MVENLSRFTFPIDWGFCRTPARPVDLQVLDFEKLYDYQTLWNDAVQINQQVILLIGPPLYNTATWLKNHCRFEEADGKLIPWIPIEMDRTCVIQLHTDKWTDLIFLNDKQHRHAIKINSPSLDFNNKKVIVTISKNHPISWLQQWIDYHRVVHNLEGLLLYNNQSTIYSSLELEQSLARDDMTIKVVDYNVPFGVMGGGLWEWQGRSGTYLPWDSDFSQYVMLEHAKWRYLHCAKLAINADTDELIYINGASLDNLADYCVDNEDSVWLYNGTWIEPVDSKTGIIANSIPFDQRSFSNYWHTNHSNQRGIGVKWALNPARNLQYQWHLHKTFGPHKSTEFIGFGHYLAMNTSWSWQRDGYQGDTNTLVEFEPIKNNIEIWQKNKGNQL